MTVVISVVALMAALVMPNLVAMKRSRDLRALEASLVRLPAEARTEARRLNSQVVLRVDGDALVMERRRQQARDARDGDDDPEEIKRLTLGDGLRVDAARKGSESVDLASWFWIVYPDGSAERAHLDIREGDATKSLLLPPDGEGRWVSSEELEDLGEYGEEEFWPAGEVERRAGG